MHAECSSDVRKDCRSGGGEGAQGLSWSRTIVSDGSYRDSTAIFLSVAGSEYIVSAGASSESFTLSGGNYASDQKTGSTLTASGGNYIYTRADGTVYLLAPWSSTATQYQGSYRVSSITYPTGEKLTFGWETVPNVCHWIEKLLQCSYVSGVRLRNVESTNGYALQFTFEVETPVRDDVPDVMWAVIKTVEVRNMSVDPASQSWPKLTLVGTQSITDSLNRTTSYAFTGGALTGIKYPGSSTNDVSIGYASGKVSSVVNEGVTTNYGYSTVGNLQTTTVSDAVAGNRLVVTDLTTMLVQSDTNELGKKTTYDYYPDSGLLKQVTAPEGNSAAFEYDARGNRTKTTLNPKADPDPPDPIVTQAAYPPSDSVDTWKCASPITTVQCNKPTSTTDANGNVTTYQWDSVTGLPTVVTQPAATTGTVQPQTRYSYASVYAKYRDAGGNLVNFATPVTRLSATSQCRTQASCAGTSDEKLVGASYANNNALPSAVTVEAGDGSIVETSAIGYDTVGNVTSVDGPLSGTADTTVAFYDLTRAQTGAISPDPGGAGTLPNLAQRTTYDSATGLPTLAEQGTTNGQSAAALAAMTVTASQATAYDTNRRPVIVTAKGSDGAAFALTQTNYTSLGQVHCVATRMNPAAYGAFPGTDACALGMEGSYGPDRIASYTYDAVGRADSVTTGYGTADAATEETLAFSSNGQVLNVRDAANNCTKYEYDGFDRLWKAHYPQAPIGGACGTTANYEQYDHDANGNVVSFRTRRAETLTLTYDNLNRLVTKLVPDRRACPTPTPATCSTTTTCSASGPTPGSTCRPAKGLASPMTRSGARPARPRRWTARRGTSPSSTT